MTHATAPQLIPPVFHAISGAIGGSLALLLFYPLERARIEMQKRLSEEIDISRRPIIAVRVPIAQQRRKDSVGRGGGSLKKNADSLEDSWSLGSSSSGDNTDDFQDALSEIDDTVSLSSCVRKLWKHNELYRGVAPLVATLAVSNFVFFYVNEMMKRLIFLPTSTFSNQRSSNSYRSLIASCLAGICNVFITNPLWVANLRIVTGESKSSKLIPEMMNVARTNGVSHLWSGTGASLLLVSNPVLQFFLYEELKVLQLRAADASLAPLQAFVAGAVAKAVATVVTYPLQVTQTVLRMQQSSETERCDEEHDHHHHQQYSGTWDCLVKVYGRDGAAGLFTGMRAKLLQTVLTAAFTFLTYEQIVTVLYATHQSLLARHRQQRLVRWHELSVS